MLPACAPARFPMATPLRLYQPRPDAIAALSLSGSPVIRPLTIPPAREPAMIPCRDHEDPDMIFFYFLYDSPIQPDADAHQNIRA